MLSNGIHIGRRNGVALGGGSSVQTHLVLTATTTAPSQTVTFNTIAPSGGSIVIDWGDGNTTTVNSNDSASKARTYAAAGTYTIRISDYERIVNINITDSKVGGTINASNKLPSALTSLTLNGLSGLTWTVGASAPMPTGLTYLFLNNLSGLTWTVGASAPMPTGLTYLLLYNLSGLTWTVGASAPMPTGLTGLEFAGLSGLTWTVGAAAPMPTGLTTLTLLALAGLTPVAVWDGINAIRTIRYENNLTQAQVDTVLQKIWENKANFTWVTPSLDLLGNSNAAPSGTYAAASPPTTGKEYAYDLVNGAYTSAGPEWTVTTA